MGALAKQLASFVTGQMAGSNNRAKFVVKTLRTGYVVSATGIAIIWYSSYRNERVAPGDAKFPFPLVSKLKRKYPADRPEKELDRPVGGGPGAKPGESITEPPHSTFNGLADGHKLQAKHPELKPGAARVIETILGHFPQLVITSTTGGNHTSGSYHYLGRGVDLGGPREIMQQAARWIAEHLSHVLTEGIHNPGLSVKNKQHVPSSFWGTETWAAHGNHIHIAV